MITESKKKLLAQPEIKKLDSWEEDVSLSAFKQMNFEDMKKRDIGRIKRSMNSSLYSLESKFLIEEDRGLNIIEQKYSESEQDSVLSIVIFTTESKMS